MLGFLTAVLVSTLAYSQGYSPPPSLLTASLFFLPCALFLRAFFWQVFLSLEENGSSKPLLLSKKDPLLQGIFCWFTLFPFISFAIASLGKTPWLLLWIPFLGISLDLSLIFLKRLETFLDPFYLLSLFEKKASEALYQKNLPDFFEWIDLLAEIGLKATEKRCLSLATKSLQTQQNVCRKLLAKADQFQKKPQEEEDPLSYALFYLFQRLDLVFAKSLNEGQEALASQVITAFGKALVDSAKCDLSLANYPIHYLGRLAKQAQSKNDKDLTLKITLTFLESAKHILKEVNLTYSHLQGPFLNLILHMQDIAKETFRKDKQTPINQLLRPFKDLKEAFQKTPSLTSHQDTAALLLAVEQVILEFEALETLLHTIPPIQKQEEEKKTPACPSTPDVSS